MPSHSSEQKQLEKDRKDIENINHTVLMALEMLMGAGGHKSGFKNLSASGASTVLKGVATDHRHKGYKDVTMKAFQLGLQRILADSYVALQLLDNNGSDLNPEMKGKLEDPENRQFILNMLGFSKQERKAIEANIDENNNAEKIMNAINEQLSHSETNKAELKQKIELMITGAMCYLPFSEPNDGMHFQIPIKDQAGNYHFEGMKVLKINMSPGVEGPYYALNLQPIHPETQKAQEQMLFMGTNPLPTASGFSVTAHADTITGNHIGENLVEASADRFEKMFKEKFKANIKNLVENHLDDFTTIDEKGVEQINYQALWLAARVKCSGQSLGGSISLQMQLKYPHMVEISAFEPPFLLEKSRKEMENNLRTAQEDFSELINDIEFSQESKNKINVDSLKQAVPSEYEELKGVLKENNIIIAQMIDYATKFGKLSTDAKILQVDTKVHASKNNNPESFKNTSTWDKVKDTIYRRVMALSLMSHAMVLAPQRDKKVVELEGLNDLFSEKSRESFTKTLDTKIWKAIQIPMKSYMKFKNLVKDNVYDPKMDPSKHPKYIESHKESLAADLNGEWETIKRSLADIETNANSWQNGAHILEKIDKFSRTMERANNLDMVVVENYKSEILKLKEVDKSGLITLYEDYLLAKISDNQDINEVQRTAYKLISDTIKSYQTKPEQLDIQKVAELYAFLDKNGRKAFIKELKEVIPQQELTQSPQKDLIFNLQSQAKSFSEQSKLKELAKPEKQTNTISSAAMLLPGFKKFQSKDNQENRENIVRMENKEESRSSTKPRK